MITSDIVQNVIIWLVNMKLEWALTGTMTITRKYRWKMKGYKHIDRQI